MRVFQRMKQEGTLDRIAELPANVILEGAGDCIWDWKRNHFWLGYGQRSDRASGDVVADVFGVDCVALELADPRFYHLYFAPAYVNRGLALEAMGAIEPSRRDYELVVLIPPETELEKRSQIKAQQRLSAVKGQIAQSDIVGEATAIGSGPAPRNDDLGASGPEPWNDGIGAQGPTFDAPSQEAPQTEPYETVKVFFATDRMRTASDKPNQAFGEARGILSLGVCEVSIPASHKTGEMEGAIIEYLENPQRHIVLQKVSQLEGEDFWGALRTRIGASSGRSAFIYVHGFNTSFRDAARRTAQLHKDLKFDGAPVFFSWPSQASPLSYVVDLANAEWSVSTLKIFLKDFATTSSADRTFIIAHSMGSLTPSSYYSPYRRRERLVVELEAIRYGAAELSRLLADDLVAGQDWDETVRVLGRCRLERKLLDDRLLHLEAAIARTRLPAAGETSDGKSFHEFSVGLALPRNHQNRIGNPLPVALISRTHPQFHAGRFERCVHGFDLRIVKEFPHPYLARKGRTRPVASCLADQPEYWP